MISLLWFLFVVCLLPFLLVPYFIWKSQSYSLSPKLKPMLSGFLPKAVDSYFSEITKSLGEIGFEHRQDAVSFDYGPHLRVFLRVLIESKSKVMAVLGSVLPDGFSEPTNNFLELLSVFPNGREVSTHNSDMMGAPIDHQSKTVLSLPMIQDPKALFLVHEKIVVRLNLDQNGAVIPNIGQEFQALVDSIKNDLLRQVKLGALHFDAQKCCFRPTLAGALIIGWCSLWPVSFIRQKLQLLRGRMALRRLA